jgi:hypothetical protein
MDIFTTSKEKLLRQQLQALHHGEMREVLTPIAPVRMPAIAKDARDIMTFEAPRHVKKVVTVPGTGFFERDVPPLDVYGEIRPRRYSRQLIDVSWSEMDMNFMLTNSRDYFGLSNQVCF